MRPLILAFAIAPFGGVTAADDWVEVKSPHFTVLSNAGRSKAWTVANEFEEIRAVFRMAISEAEADPARPIVIYAVRNEDDLRTLLPELGEPFPVGVFRAAADKYRIALRIDVTGADRFRALYHEYHHLLFRLDGRRAPVWVVEGLAEFWSQAVIRRDMIELGNPNPDHLRVLRLTQTVPLEALLRLDGFLHRSQSPEQVAALYAQSAGLSPRSTRTIRSLARPSP